MKTTIDTNAAEKLRAAINDGKLKSGSWGDGNSTVCMMSAIVSGARSVTDCATTGWPEWLADLNVFLFDATVGAADEAIARAEFALRIAELVQSPRDYDRARDLFLIRRLDDGDHSALKSLRKNPVDAECWVSCEAAITGVADLLRRRVDGEDVKGEMTSAFHAANVAYAAGHAATAYAAETTRCYTIGNTVRCSTY